MDLCGKVFIREKGRWPKRSMGIIDTVETRLNTSRPIVQVVLNPSVGQYDHARVASALFDLPECQSFRSLLLVDACRAVGCERLPTVIRNGVDVDRLTLRSGSALLKRHSNMVDGRR